jgi:hypothetical protein
MNSERATPLPVGERVSQGVPQLRGWFPNDANEVRCVLKAQSAHQQQVRMSNLRIVGGAGKTGALELAAA